LDSNYLRNNYYMAGYFARKFSKGSFIISLPKGRLIALNQGA
jgi:hypothetical protein